MAARSESRPPTAPTIRADSSGKLGAASSGAVRVAGSNEGRGGRNGTRSYGTRDHRLTSRAADPEERRSVRRAMTLGAFVWPSFFLADLYLGLVVYPGAPLALYAGFRLLGEVAIFAVYRISLQQNISSRRLKATNALVCTLCSILISIMALRFGGLASPYIHGLSLVIFVEALAVPAPWRDTLWYAAPSVASYTVISLIASLFDPALAASRPDGHQVA